MTVAGGTLGGSGLIRGPVIDSIRRHDFARRDHRHHQHADDQQQLNLSGTMFLALNPAAGTNDLIRGLTTVTYGGTLALTNFSGAYNSNSVFKIFSAANYSGAFTNISANAARARLRVEHEHAHHRWHFAGGADCQFNADEHHLLGQRQSTHAVVADELPRLAAASPNQRPSAGLGTNWVDVAEASATNSVIVTIDPGNGTVFYRMIFP